MNSTLKKLSGTGGETPFADSATRAAYFALINIGIGLLSTIVTITAEQLAYIYAAVNPALVVVFGIWDWANKEPDVPAG